MTRKQIKLLRNCLKEAASHKPFVGIKEKDYYRGQWDAYATVIEYILKLPLYTKKELDND